MAELKPCPFDNYMCMCQFCEDKCNNGLAMVQRTSVNQVINAAIEKHLEGHQGDIKRYNDFFGEE